MNSKRMIIGVDPGLSGSLALYDPDLGCLQSVHDMPITTKGEDRAIDTPALALLIKSFASSTLFAVIEDVHAMPKQGVVSMFNFGFSTGIAHGVLHSNGIAVYKIKPAIWKMQLSLSRDKEDSLNLARKKFPSHAHHFRLKKHDGRAEAALLAWFGAEKLLAHHLEL